MRGAGSGRGLGYYLYLLAQSVADREVALAGKMGSMIVAAELVVDIVVVTVAAALVVDTAAVTAVGDRRTKVRRTSSNRSAAHQRAIAVVAAVGPEFAADDAAEAGRTFEGSWTAVTAEFGVVAEIVVVGVELQRYLPTPARSAIAVQKA